jgi:hypothetical protein
MYEAGALKKRSTRATTDLTTYSILSFATNLFPQVVLRKIRRHKKETGTHTHTHTCTKSCCTTVCFNIYKSNIHRPIAVKHTNCVLQKRIISTNAF